jgi:hypothetical protein
VLSVIQLLKSVVVALFVGKLKTILAEGKPKIVE